jgi:ribose transport system permease protein
VKIFAFALTGALAAFAGILGLSFLSYVQGVTGQGLELSVIAAVIIGGTALSGGSGSMGRTLIGVLIIGVLQNFLALMNVSSFWQTLIVGVVIIVAAGFDRWGGSSREAAR